LTWNQRHLLHALREFEAFFNEHRPHQGIANAHLFNPLPPPITNPNESPAWMCAETSVGAESSMREHAA
jgi:hypothetical protein